METKIPGKAGRGRGINMVRKRTGRSARREGNPNAYDPEGVHMSTINSRHDLVARIAADAAKFAAAYDVDVDSVERVATRWLESMDKAHANVQPSAETIKNRATRDAIVALITGDPAREWTARELADQYPDVCDFKSAKGVGGLLAGAIADGRVVCDPNRKAPKVYAAPGHVFAKPDADADAA